MIKNREKIADQVKKSEIVKEDDSVKVGKAYDFLFEGENNKYDDEYSDYI